MKLFSLLDLNRSLKSEKLLITMLILIKLEFVASLLKYLNSMSGNKIEETTIGTCNIFEGNGKSHCKSLKTM